MRTKTIVEKLKDIALSMDDAGRNLGMTDSEYRSKMYGIAGELHSFAGALEASVDPNLPSFLQDHHAYQNEVS